MSKYDEIISWVFEQNYDGAKVRIPFNREELATACDALGYSRIKNLGDIPYSFRFRRELPDFIRSKAPSNQDWIILGTGIAEYEFRLASPSKISPSSDRLSIKVPDATPEILKMYAPGTDEQALLTKVRYNRLIDIFLGVTCYSIQNHYRTTVQGIGQIEVDEIYVGVNKRGTHFVIPCQAKSPGDRFGIVQVLQDIRLCAQNYPNAICRPIALQFTGENEVSILELSVEEKQGILRLSVVDEKHYSLNKREDISENELQAYLSRE